MTSTELRQKYLDFFKTKEHAIIPSASLVPENDPTVLFTTAGMHPLVPYLLGEKHPQGQRLANAQKCIRTGDIDEVGDITHHTFFEMLGNWSLGNPDAENGIGAGYFKNEAIEWSWEFLTSSKWLGLDPRRLAVSVFEGDPSTGSGRVPRDDEAADIWMRVSGRQLDGRIDYLPKAKNWWGPAGETGPCGPDTEIFYWIGEEPAPEKITQGDLADHPKWVEIWNNVFMQFNKTADKKYEPLTQQNVDTGMGLERTLAVVNGLDDNYKTELFTPIVKKIEELSGKKYAESAEVTKAMRVISDHIKAATFIIGDDKGIAPSNAGQGYMVRRLIRRAVRYGKLLNTELNNLPASRLYPQAGSDADSASKQFSSTIAAVVIDIYKDVYPELEKNKKFILDNLSQEEEKFEKTLEKGIKEFEKLTTDKEISGEEAFVLFSTYGFPIELTKEIASEKGLTIDENSFRVAMEAHQELSRTASAGMFKGGLADAGEESKKYHTATHLLLAALRETLGSEIYQKGSNINAERMRFDFNYPQKLTEEQIKKIEELVNKKIGENISVEMVEMPKEEALKIVKTSFDPAKYGDVVKVYKIGDFSIELCGGPHAAGTGELGVFKITKEEASSAGVRRIKAVLE